MEAELIFRFLFGKAVPLDIANRYESALGFVNIETDAVDKSLWKRICDHPWMLGPLESYHAIKKPHSGIRQRVQLMNAIVEATPEHSALFLPQSRSLFYLIKIGMVGVRAVLLFIVGVFLNTIYGN